MYIGENGNAWSSLEHYRAALAAKTDDTGDILDIPSGDTKISSGATDTEQQSNTAATGTTTGHLSSETLAYLVHTQSRPNEGTSGVGGMEESSVTTAALSAGTLSEETLSALQRFDAENMTRIANDPEYATEQARQLGTFGSLIRWDESQMPKNGDPASVWTAFGNKSNALAQRVEETRQQREALYNSKVAQGVAPAEIYADLLEFNANLQQDYGDSLDQSGNTPPGTWKEWNQAKLDYLKEAMGQIQGQGQGRNQANVPDETVGASIDQEQSIGETERAHKGDTAWFTDQNTMTSSDRKLLEAMTGYTVDENGVFYDKYGKQGFPEDLTQHTLRSFLMDLGDARHGRSAPLQGEDITLAEFTEMMKRAQAVAAGMGEIVNYEYLEKGVAYLNG